jgi:putative membrane protein
MRGGHGPPWRDSGSHRRESSESETPLEILRRRYATGEITKEEFDQMSEDLAGQ